MPEVGKEIENFVTECGAGTDAQQRIGVITFNENRKMQKKQTFKHEKEHLEEKFKIKISYGSLVQLCTARNRRKSASCTKVLLRFFKKEQGFYFEVQSRQTLKCCILSISK